MHSSSNRERTFAAWKPSAKQLADAGFIQLSSTFDSTKCVYCGLTLFKWNKEDDPWADHSYNRSFCIGYVVGSTTTPSVGNGVCVKHITKAVTEQDLIDVTNTNYE